MQDSGQKHGRQTRPPHDQGRSNTSGSASFTRRDSCAQMDKMAATSADPADELMKTSYNASGGPKMGQQKLSSLDYLQAHAATQLRKTESSRADEGLADCPAAYQTHYPHGFTDQSAETTQYRENQILISNQTSQQPTHRRGMATMAGGGGKERHHKSKAKKSKANKLSIQEQHLQSMLLNISQSPSKKKHKAGGGHVNNYSEQIYNTQAHAQELQMSQHVVAMGHGGSHVRRKMAAQQEHAHLSHSHMQSSSTKASQHKLSLSKKNGPVSGAHGILHLPQGGQAYAYAAQIKEAAERGVTMGVHHPRGAKHHGHRKHQPVAIDTFNIVSNRRTSLISRVNDASEVTKANSQQASAIMTGTFSRQIDAQPQYQSEHLSNQQNLAEHEQLAAQVASSPHRQPSGAGTGALKVDLSLQSSAGGLVLPDIISQRKSGMGHPTAGPNPNQTPSQHKHLNYQHRGSNSFSGVSGKHVLSSVNEQDNLQGKVLSEKGEPQGRRIGGQHQRTQQSADLQAQMQSKLYPPPMAHSQVTNDFQSLGQSTDPTGNIIVGAEAQRPDLKRRTTGTLFQAPNVQADSSKPQSQLNCSNFTKTPGIQSHVLSPHGQHSQGQSSGQVNRRIQNIVSPIIQDISPNQVSRRAGNNNNLALGASQTMSKAPQQQMAYASALEHKVLHQSVGDAVRPSRYPPLQSEQQSAAENSLLYDSMMQNRRNPTSNPSGHPDHNLSEENVASTGHSRKAQLPESRINADSLTPERGRDATTGGQAAGNQGAFQRNEDGPAAIIEQDEGKAAGAAQKHTAGKQNQRGGGQRDAKDGSAHCRVDTDLSGRAFVAAAHANAADGELGSAGDEWQGRREDKARTQNRADDPKHLRQVDNQRVIHSKQDHVGKLPSNLLQSEDQYGPRKGASFLQNNESGLPSQESETSDEEEDEEEEDDEVSMGKAPDPQMNATVGRSDLYPQPQDLSDLNMAHQNQNKFKKRHPAIEANNQTQYSGFHQIHTAAGGAPKEKRKGKRHRRQNTHHHYHIDFNFEQVNNILVSYGGLGLQQSLKHHQGGKKGADAGGGGSKANVSMSMGHVHGQFASGNNHPNRGTGASSSVPSHGTGQYGNPGGAAGGKRGQMHPHPGPNGLLLPELIINKNKINFGSKQYRMHADDQRVSNRQLKEAAQNVTQYHLAQQMMAASNRGPGAHGGQKTRKKKHKKDTSQYAMPFEEFQQIPAPMTQKKQVTEKYRTPKRPQMSQSLNPGLMSQQIQNYQSSENRPVNIGQLDGNGTITFGRTPQDSIKVLRQSQVNMYNPGPPQGAAGNAADQQQQRAAGEHGQGYRGMLSKGSDRSRDSNREDSPRQLRERPTNQVLNDPKAQQQTNVASSAAKRAADDRRQSREKIADNQHHHSEQKPSNASNPLGQRHGGQQTANSATKGAASATSPTIVKMVGTGQGPGGVALRARQKQPLHVITKGPPSHGQSGVIETPKRFFNIKAHNRGGSRARIGALDPHSAGLRSGQRNAEPEDGSQTAAGQPTGAPRATYNTLSQISSVMSGSAEKDGARRGSATGSRPAGGPPAQPATSQPNRGTGFLGPRTQKVKTILREQEKKLKQIDAQNRRTHQMLEQFNNPGKAGGQSAVDLQTAGDGNANEANGGSSPMHRHPEPKATKPKITDFELEGVIGIGNFGKVHKAFNKKELRVCALKVLRKESVAQMKHVDHIINELEVLQYLSDRDKQAHQEWLQRPRDKDDEDEEEEEYVSECPFLMHMYSTFQDKENLYFELEYIQGCTLFSQIRLYNQRVQKNMTFYAIEVLLALSYLHNNCIIYRDLKPENIVVSMTERGHIKLVDFGFAKMMRSPSQRTFTNCGTPAYIAPEVLIDNNGHGPEVDVWSFGVLMCEIASGQTPFHAESTLEVYENINKCQPVYNKLISQTLRDMLNKVFVKDPEVRMTLEQMKRHRVFAEHDWKIPVKTLFWCGSGPFIPQEAMFNEKADRESEKPEPAKPKNILAAIMGNPLADDKGDKAKPQKDLNFDEMHYNKFEREEERARDHQEIDSPTKRKRQNPLGDFKFVKINELF